MVVLERRVISGPQICLTGLLDFNLTGRYCIHFDDHLRILPVRPPLCQEYGRERLKSSGSDRHRTLKLGLDIWRLLDLDELIVEKTEAEPFDTEEPHRPTAVAHRVQTQILDFSARFQSANLEQAQELLLPYVL